MPTIDQTFTSDETPIDRIMAGLGRTSSDELADYIEGEFDAYDESTTNDRRSPSLLAHMAQVAYAAEALEALTGLSPDETISALEVMDELQVRALDGILADIEGDIDDE